MRITENHMAILAALDRLGSSYASALVGEVDQKQQHISNRLLRLAAEGLVESVDPPGEWAEANARQVGVVRFWRLTERGKAMINEQ